MQRFTFYIEGLNREVPVDAINEKDARGIVWNDLTNDERDAVVQFECIDVEVIPAGAGS